MCSVDSSNNRLHFSNVHDDIPSGSAAVLGQATHIVNPVVIAAGAAGTNAAMKDDDKHNLDEEGEQQKIVDKEILKNGDACTDNIDIDSDDHAYHNASTMRYRKKTGSDNTDLDSIEHLDFEDEDKKHEGLEDDIDSVSAITDSPELSIKPFSFRCRCSVLEVKTCPAVDADTRRRS